MPWHIRVHQISTNRVIHVAEGSFSAPDYGTSNQIELLTDIDNAVFYQTEVGITGLVGLSKELSVSLTEPEPNTSLYFAKTKLPLQTGILQPGNYTLVSLYLGDRDLESLNQDGKLIIPSVELAGKQLTYTLNGRVQKVSLIEF